MVTKCVLQSAHFQRSSGLPYPYFFLFSNKLVWFVKYNIQLETYIHNKPPWPLKRPNSPLSFPPNTTSSFSQINHLGYCSEIFSPISLDFSPSPAPIPLMDHPGLIMGTGGYGNTHRQRKLGLVS